MSSFVLDASALLALLNQEPGKDLVEEVIGDCSISAVNYCEVIGKLIDAGVPDDDARHTVDLLNIEIVDFDANLALRAASLCFATKRLGLSLGDRCCLALGTARKVTVLTSDRNWSKLKIGVKVKLIR
ncbi:MAG TPA: type II toxin-antitoxin system VapC family toxin [Blastocatellia bacterium]|nr:type II toxin-antitoxin system VapC family toxin [Blastocatellia bacterium]